MTEFRKATKADIQSMCEIRKIQLQHEGIEPNINIDEELRVFFEEMFSSNSIVEYLAEENGNIIATGAVIFYNYPPSYTNKSGKIAYITNMFTEPQYRGRGIATKMLGLLEKEVKARGIHVMRLGASKLGRPVYEKFGFEQENEWLSKRI